MTRQLPDTPALILVSLGLVSPGAGKGSTVKRKRYSRKCNLLALQPKRFQQIALEHRRRYGYRRFREVMLLQGSLSIERMCQLVPVSRRSSIDR